MSFDQELLSNGGNLFLQVFGLFFDFNSVGTESTIATPVRKVEAVLDLGESMLREVHSFHELSIVDVVQSDIESDESVEIQLFELIHSVLDGVYNSGSCFLITIE